MINPKGYSGTPLARKLGIKIGSRVMIVNAPIYYMELFSDMPDEVIWCNDKKRKKDIIHYFATQAEKLRRDIVKLRRDMEENGMIWVSWPKQSAKVDTDLNENIVREIALANGLVDVKVCAVDQTWSGLKLVIRLQDRK